MSQQSYERIPHAGLEFLLTRVLSPRVGVDDAMWHVRRLYGVAGMTDQDWSLIRERVAKLLARLRGHAPTQAQRRSPGELT
jgi:hypothetical protein